MVYHFHGSRIIGETYLATSSFESYLATSSSGKVVVTICKQKCGLQEKI